MTQQQKKIFRSIRDYIMIALGMLFYGIGWTVFLLPNNITTGGVGGVASIVYWGTGISVQFTYFAINATLLVVALRVLGWKFCVKTVYAVIILTLLLGILPELTKDSHLLADQPFMASIIGSVFCGSGVGFALSSNGSTGGTDIIAAIINKYRDISLGTVIMLCDVVIISSSYFVLHDWECVIYGFVVLVVTAFTIDQVVDSARRSVQFFIISEKSIEIGHRINTEMHRGCSVIEAQGLYTGERRHMLFVLAKKTESSRIFRLINDVDPAAFVSQSAVIGVYGKGFDHIKGVKHKQEKQHIEQ